MMYIRFTYHQSCGCNIAGGAASSAGAAHREHLAAIAQHYQRQLVDQIPGTQEPPPSLFAPPPVPLPVPVPGPVSIFPVALACAVILQVLIISLGLCAGTVGGFEPDSGC
jgi:hypothetical protein